MSRDPGEQPANATLEYGAHSPRATLRDGPVVELTRAVDSSLRPAQPISMDADLDATIDAPSNGTAAPRLGGSMSDSMRTTVLPRRKGMSVEGAEPSPARPRFQSLRVLGTGAMGEVELARDNDIRRTVAVKRLHDQHASDTALMRFADEVRIVGQLEHPSIVPVYDVGRDDAGRVYLVMKHLDGETMEEIIGKLRAGDPEYHETYTISYRVRLFLGVLDAIRYAHARGIIHRDIKPANIMIGAYGEVTVLDWGLAKPIRGADAESSADDVSATVSASQDERMHETQLGAIAGTPFYMSPEQAAGKNDQLDERSDVYSLTMVFYEWLTTHHPLQHLTTISQVIASVITHDYTFAELHKPAMATRVPMEYFHLVRKGLRRGPDERFQSVAEMEGELKGIAAGQIHINCHVTLAKKALLSAVRTIDRHPLGYTLALLTVVVSTLIGFGYLLRTLAT